MPDPTRNAACSYFYPKRDYFWRWADDAMVAEWKDGSTIGFREELTDVLESLAPDGLPSLGAVMLMLAACRDEWKRSNALIGILQGQSNADALPVSKDEMKARWTEAVQLMDTIAELPAEFRHSVEAKKVLAGIIFESADRRIPPENSRAILRLWRSGELDREMAQPRADLLHGYRFYRDIVTFIGSVPQIGAESLLNRLRTGLDQAVKAPAVELPPPSGEGLMAELLSAPETAGLARLTRHVMAAMRIPMHSSDRSDQPFGGYSDISNRGQIDRLLVSELALDDLTLAARIVNNEALYLEREAPPRQPPRQRIVLLDNGLRMWGTPRIFSLAVALAARLKADKDAVVDTCSLVDGEFRPARLETKQDVLAQMEVLSPELSPAAALKLFMQQEPNSEADIIFVTHRSTLAKSQFKQEFASLDRHPDYVAAVDSDGRFELYDSAGGRRSRLSSAKLDLDEILHKSSAERADFVRTAEHLPVAVTMEPFPLRFPVAKVRLKGEHITHHEQFGVVASTQDGRLLHWPEKDRGAVELIRGLPMVETSWTRMNELGEVAVVTQENEGLHLAYRQLFSPAHRSFRLPFEGSIAGVDFVGAYLLIFMAEAVRAVLASTGEEVGRLALEDGESWVQDNFVKKGASEYLIRFDGMALKRVKCVSGNMLRGHAIQQNRKCKHAKDFVGRPHSLLTRLQIAYVGPLGHLTFVSHTGNRHRITAWGRKVRMQHIPDENALQVKRFHTIDTGDLGLSLRCAEWPSGDRVYLDRRGLVHLVPARKDEPELSILLLQDQETACWLSDGRWYGPEYFIADRPSVDFELVMNAITRFVERLS